MCAMQVDAVQSGDGKGKDELKESQHDTRESAAEATAGGMRANCIENGHGKE